jgi:glyoxylase-like metal-dependent hydrolase (beta-lactamase superfamily II)
VALATLGIAPAEITHVLITHTHDDHYSATTVERDGRLVPRFPRAWCFVGRGDWEGQDPAGPLAVRLGALDRPGLLELVDGVREVAPGITMLPAPGETPGHSIVRISSAGETLYYVGDLFHHHCEIAHPDWVSPGRDPVAMQASRERLLADAAREQATVVYTHAPFPGWGRIVLQGDGYRWQPA